MHTEPTHQKYLAKLLLLIAAVCFFLLSLSAYYAQPNIEDFALAVAPREIGIFPSVINLLTFFDSRFTANLLHGFNILVWNIPEYYFIMPILCVLLLFGSIYFLVNSIFVHQSYKLIYALAFTGVYFALQPLLNFGLYYMASTFVYIYPIMLWCIWIACFFKSIQNTKSNLYYAFIGMIALFFSFGGSELMIVFNAMSFFCIAIYYLWFYKKLPWLYFSFACIAFATLFFVLKGPSEKFSNEKILINLTERYPDTHFALESLEKYGDVILHQLFHPVSLGFFIFSIFFFHKRYFIEKWDTYKFFFVVLSGLIFLFSYLASWIYFIPIGTINEPVPHVFNTIFFFMILPFYVLLPIVFNLFFYDAIQTILSCYKLVYFSTISGMVIGFLVINNNLLIICQEWYSGTFHAMKVKHHQFYKEAKAMQNKNLPYKILYFENPNPAPKSNYYGPDILPDRESSDWNKALEDYFYLDEVRLINDTVVKHAAGPQQ